MASEAMRSGIDTPERARWPSEVFRADGGKARSQLGRRNLEQRQRALDQGIELLLVAAPVMHLADMKVISRIVQRQQIVIGPRSGMVEADDRHMDGLDHGR